MKRKIVLVLACCLVLGTVGCGSESTAEGSLKVETIETTGTSEKTELADTSDTTDATDSSEKSDTAENAQSKETGSAIT